MKLKYKNGDRVIITKEPTLFGTTHHKTTMLGRVVEIDGYFYSMERYGLKGFNWLTVSESEVTPVTEYSETEELLNERFWYNEEYRLRQFVVGVFAFVFFVVGGWFLTESIDNVINLFSGVVSLSGSIFCIYRIREVARSIKSLRSEFDGNLYLARFNDLMEL